MYEYSTSRKAALFRDSSITYGFTSLPSICFCRVGLLLRLLPVFIPEFHAISTMYSFGGISLNFHDCNSFIFVFRNESRSKSRNAVF